MKPDNTPENVKKLRLKAGLTQKECSHIYGVGLRTWQKKEEVNTAAPRFGAMWLLCCPGIFVRPFHPLTRIKKRDNNHLSSKKTGENLQIRLKSRIVISSKGEWPLSQ
ncbi:hypothetical protein BFD67_25650 [Escherichia coli]|nr:hypothetical protein BFD67_25650 [Escherichia coli]